MTISHAPTPARNTGPAITARRRTPRGPLSGIGEPLLRAEFVRCLSKIRERRWETGKEQNPRDIHENARDVAQDDDEGLPQIARQRKPIEMRFAHLKTHHGFERLRLRGLSGARDEFHLAAIVQNLKTLALRLIRPPPQAPPARELRRVGWWRGRQAERPHRPRPRTLNQRTTLPHQTRSQANGSLSRLFDSISQERGWYAR